MDLRAQLGEPPLALLPLAPLGQVAAQPANLLDNVIPAGFRLRTSPARRRLTAATSNVFLQRFDLGLQALQHLLQLVQRLRIGAVGLGAGGIAGATGGRIAALGLGAGLGFVVGHGSASPCLCYLITGGIQELRLLLLLEGPRIPMGRRQLLDDDDELGCGSSGRDGG